LSKTITNFISSKHYVKSQLVAPPGVDVNKLVEIVASQIARTIIHEAAHGERWAQEYLSGNLSLTNMNRNEEEQFAEQAEQRSGLNSNFSGDIFNEQSTSSDVVQPEKLLDRAINLANDRNSFYIPRNSVKNTSLKPGAWGEFEMVSGPDLKQHKDITIAWDNNDRKLLVDVNAIIEEYNTAIQNSMNVNTVQVKENIQPSHNTSVSVDNSVGSAQSIPGIPGR